MADVQFLGREMIAEQEVSGRQSFIESDTLPTMIWSGSRNSLEEAGVKFLAIVDDDPKFQYVELPEKWKKIPHPTVDGNDFWTCLIDETGATRAEIFFKAGFHAREAWMRIPE
ncbi:hypothetical protein BH11PAT2_BH11PAT2_08820 [soil metagenome]